MARGFTLLELVVVMGLLVALGGISALYSRAVRSRLNLAAATRQVVMDLKVARMRAVAQHTTRRVQFSSIGAQYRHQQRSGRTYVDDGVPIGLPAGITIADCTAAERAISFRPRGTAGSFGTVTLQNGDGMQRQIVVDIAGQVRVP